MTSKTIRKPSWKLMQTLSQNIRILRLGKNLSQEELAHISGLHRTYIGSVERCERNVTLSTLETLAIALDVTISELLTRRDQNK